MLRKIIVIIFITLLCSIILSYFIEQTITKVTWANSIFFCSLFLTIIGGAMLVLQGGFFNGMIRSFRQLFHKTNRVEQILNEINNTKEDVIPYNLTFPLTFPILLAGSLLLLFSFIFSWAISF